jgi:hypothetical protein
MSDQLLVIVDDRRRPSSVSPGSLPLDGSTTSEVSRLA